MPNSEASAPRRQRSGRHYRKILVAAAFAAAVAALLQLTVPNAPVSAAIPPQALSAQTPGSFADLVTEVQPTVVNIATTSQIRMGGPGAVPEFRFPEGSPFEHYFREFFKHGMPDQPGSGPPPRAKALGSGFIISADGYVVTNHHVIHNAEEISVKLHNGDHYPATVVGRDLKTDLALLKIDTREPLPYVEFGDSDGARVGDWVIAVGNPFGLGGSVSAGIISARGRDLRSGPFDDFLQIDAPINRGNSGGPLFDRQGKVIGVNTAIFSPSGGNVGIGFAIPSSLAKTVVASLKENGRVDRGWLGVHIQEITGEIAQGLEMEDTRGALVAGVEPGGPADSAGFRPGDVILEFNGKQVEKVKDLPRIVAAANANDTVRVRVLRDGEEKTIDVTIGRMPIDDRLAGDTPAGKPPGAGRLGLALAPLTPEIRQRLGLPDGAEGVVIADVERNSPAAREGLRPGDVIKRVGSRKVASPDEVVAAINDSTRRKAVLLLISRQGNHRFIAVPLDKA